MKNLIMSLFFWVLFLLAVNAFQQNVTVKRVSELEKKTADCEYEIFRLRKEIEYIKNPYMEVYYGNKK